MKFGVREICDVVLRAKNAQKIGNKVFYKNEPVLYFDSLKTSSMEGQATTVYAQGGRGNARLIAWEGERTVTFTMEDALISPMGFSILTGAGLIEGDNNTNTSIVMHVTEQTTISSEFDNEADTLEIKVKEDPYFGEGSDYDNSTDIKKAKDSDKENYVYVMLLDDKGEVVSEPYIASTAKIDNGEYFIVVNKEFNDYKADFSKIEPNSVVLIDYYTEKKSGAFQINITPDKFGGNFYLEASTLFRDTNGVDLPAEFIIPNCKIQSNFTFTMASSGDPSTFTFTMDAFPDYTRWDKSTKVYAAIQVINTGDQTADFERYGTKHDYGTGNPYATEQAPILEKIIN